MDKLIYVAMTGAKQVMLRQDNVAHNLANVDTPGFRAQMGAFRATPALGDGLPSRVFSVESTPAADFSAGPIRQTGRVLDIALQGPGWIAVQDADGGEAYSREGSLQIDANGVLMTSSGRQLLSDAGLIAIPADHVITIADDGTVSATPSGQGAANSIAVGRIKLVNPLESDLRRGDDGLFRLANGESAPADETTRIASGALEGSNVSAVDALVSMIALAREFEMQMKMLQTADANAREATRILSTSG